jgi:hypothetical protein
MRDPRPGIPWSRGRVAKREKYGSYMDSPEWYRKREQWAAEWRDTTGTDIVCAVCGETWTLHQGDLHHRTYDRLGHERLTDLVPMCRSCHKQLHTVMESTSAWRRMGRVSATDMIIARMASQVTVVPAEPEANTQRVAEL